MSDLSSFQSFLYKNIPLVEQMQLQLHAISEKELTASAPIAPNINDKSTVFGGSSAALMTICGWTLIKYNLEKMNIDHDVVIHKAQTIWQQAQYDDLSLKISTVKEIDWVTLSELLIKKNRSTKITLKCQVYNQHHKECSNMKGDYVILKKPKT